MPQLEITGEVFQTDVGRGKEGGGRGQGFLVVLNKKEIFDRFCKGVLPQPARDTYNNTAAS